MRKTQNIEFTAEREPRRRVRLRVLIIVLAVFLAGALSFLFIMARNDFDFALFLGTRTEDETTQDVSAPTETASAAPTIAAPFSDENAVNVLFFCAENGSSLDFCELVSFSVKENAIHVKPVSLESDFSWNGRDYTLKKLFDDFSASAVAASFQDKGIRVSRYVNVTESAFKQILQMLGDVTVNVPRDVSFAQDGITYSLSAGEQTLRGDTVLNFMKYAYAGDEKLTAEGVMFAAILQTHFTEENVRRGEDFFSALISRASTDLSVFDYAAHKDAVLQFLANAPAISVIS